MIAPNMQPFTYKTIIESPSYKVTRLYKGDSGRWRGFIKISSGWFNTFGHAELEWSYNQNTAQLHVYFGSYCKYDLKNRFPELYNQLHAIIDKDYADMYALKTKYRYE